MLTSLIHIVITDVLIYGSGNLVIAGGVLFKVYVVGEAIKVVRRFSLPDVSKRELSTNAGVFRFPRVSCAAASADDADLDPGIAGKFILSEKPFLYSVRNLVNAHACVLLGIGLGPHATSPRCKAAVKQSLATFCVVWSVCLECFNFGLVGSTCLC